MMFGDNMWLPYVQLSVTDKENPSATTNIPFTKKYSSDMCNLIVRQLLNYRPTAVGRILLSIPESKV